MTLFSSVSAHVRDGEAWLVGYRTLAKLAVVTNAFILALNTSIPGLLVILIDKNLLFLFLMIFIMLFCLLSS